MDNITNASAAFKQVYHEGSDVYIKQQNLNCPFSSKISVAPEKPSVEGVFNAITIRGNEVGSAIYETESFQQAGYRITAKPKIPVRLYVKPFEVSGSVIRLSASNKQAFAKEADSIIQDTMARGMSDIEYYFTGIGTGQVTLANGAGSGATSLIVDDVLPFRANMFIDVWTSLGGTQEVANVQITNVNPSTNTLTLATAQTWSDNSIVSRAFDITASVTSLATAKVPTGIQGIVDTTTYSTTFEGISVSTYNEWQANVISASGAPVSQDALSRLYNRLFVIGGGTPTKLASNVDQSRVFKNSELQKVHYVAQDIKAGTAKNGEKQGMYWGDLEWEVYKTFPVGQLFMLDMETIKKYQVAELALSDLPGYTMYQKNNQDVVGGYFVYQGNLGTWKRNANGKITDLAQLSF